MESEVQVLVDVISAGLRARFPAENIGTTTVIRGDMEGRLEDLVLRLHKGFEERITEVFRAVISIVALSNWIPSFENKVGISFFIATNEFGPVIRISSISRDQNPLHGEFFVRNSNDSVGPEVNWIESHRHRYADRQMWMKSPSENPSRLLIGNIPNIATAWLILHDCKASCLSFQSLSILDLGKRPWNMKLELSGQFAVMIDV